MADPYGVTLDMVVVSRAPTGGGYRHVVRTAAGSTLAGRPVELDWDCATPLGVGTTFQMTFDSRAMVDGETGRTLAEELRRG